MWPGQSAIHRWSGWALTWRRQCLVEKIGRLNLIRIEEQLGVQIRAGAAHAHQVVNPPATTRNIETSKRRLLHTFFRRALPLEELKGL